MFSLCYLKKLVEIERVSDIFVIFAKNILLMNYDSNIHIDSVDDVVIFFHHLVSERKISFRPDDDFIDDVFFSSGKSVFSEEEVSLYNRLMGESFDLCEKSNIDIYSLGFDEMRSVLSMNNA